MPTDKNEGKGEKEREIDSFLRNAQESSRRRPAYDEWDVAPPRKSGKNNMLGIALIGGLVVLVIIALFVIKEMKGIKGVSVDKIIERDSDSAVSNDNLKIDQGKYQAVFLTNGQVYFGKIGVHTASYMELIDIYYLQVKPVLQQGEEGNNNKNPQEQKTELSLVKLGNELHGPLDRMMINTSQVVFVEDLKDDSKVTDAIKRYQQQGQK